MRRVAILNQKGGVGKTTTAANLGAALALRGRRVLLVDLDPQGNLTDHLGVEPGEDALTVYDVLTEGTALADAAVATGTEGLHVVPSHEDLAGVELELASQPGRETRLRKAFDRLAERSSYDYAIVDCPPSLGLLSLNAMAAVDEVYIALQTEYFALRGLTQLQRILELVRTRVHPGVRLAGILATLVDPVTNLAREVTEEVRRHFGDLVFRTRIRKSVRLAEAPGHQRHVFDYAPDSTGADDYRALAEEVEARAPVAKAPAAPSPAVAKPPAPVKAPAAVTPPATGPKPPAVAEAPAALAKPPAVATKPSVIVPKPPAVAAKPPVVVTKPPAVVAKPTVAGPKPPPAPAVSAKPGPAPVPARAAPSPAAVPPRPATKPVPPVPIRPAVLPVLPKPVVPKSGTKPPAPAGPASAKPSAPGRNGEARTPGTRGK